MKEIKPLLKEIETESKMKNFPIIGPNKGEIIKRIIKKYKPRKILEIGALHGYSAIIMGKTGNVKITTIEANKQSVEIARKNIEKARLKSRIKVIFGNALEIIPKLRQKFDMVFIDATKKEYIKYIKLVENKLNKKAVILADNTKRKEVKDYLNYVRSKYKSRTIKTVSFLKEKEDFMELSIKD